MLELYGLRMARELPCRNPDERRVIPGLERYVCEVADAMIEAEKRVPKSPRSMDEEPLVI
jgi:hypothetical protein